MKEKDLWGRIREGLFPGHWERVEARYPQGFPDSYCLWRGRVIFVELKMVDRVEDLRTEISAEQALWNMNHRRRGGEAWVCAQIRESGEVLWFEDAVAVRRGIYATGYSPFV